MTNSDDWRLTNQDEYLRGVQLKYRRYTLPGPTWDHDHCEFCWRKFMDRALPDTLQEGYTTEDARHWICRDCFIDFHERFEWTLSD